MAIDFEWNGRRSTARKVRRKLAWNEHRGVAYYDRERMKRTLAPIVHPRDFEGWSTPLLSWIAPIWSAPDATEIQRVERLPVALDIARANTANLARSGADRPPRQPRGPGDRPLLAGPLQGRETLRRGGDLGLCRVRRPQPDSGRPGADARIERFYEHPATNRLNRRGNSPQRPRFRPGHAALLGRR